MDELVEEITVDANGEFEQLWTFRQAFEDNVSVPCEATVIGEAEVAKAYVRAVERNMTGQVFDAMLQPVNRR